MKVIVSAAGTAGHINPALAISNKIREKEPDSEIIFIGTNRGLENDLVPRSGYELKRIEAYGLKKELSITNFKHIIQTWQSQKEVKKIIDEFQPDLVVGTGGYICGPVFMAALSKKVPTILHESNAYPGKAIKFLAKKVDCVLVGFEEAKEKMQNAKKIVVTGNPTKIKKMTIPQNEKKRILEDLGIKNDLPIVLVFGGSQGAQKINEAIVDLVKSKLNQDYQIIWATGRNQYDTVKESFENSTMSVKNLKNVKVLPYIYNMEELINVADLVICRSGAMTITELTICSKPAIFVPLPSKSANRQEDNARVLEKLGAAKIILNHELTGEKLANEIDDVIKDKAKLEKMGKAANQIAPHDVEEKIYEEIRKIVKNKK